MLLALGVIMIAASAWVAWGGIVPQGSWKEFMGWVGVVFFSLCLAIIIWRLVHVSDVLVSLTPDGILDKRVAERPIPWSAVQDVGVWTMQGQKVIVLPVSPEVEAGLGLTRMARWTRGANAKLGADGLCITAAGLKIKHDDLLAAIIERVNAARNVS